MSDEMFISPGWAVGWYFVPFANLFKPLQAMKEIWLESNRAGTSYESRGSAILGWWWGLFVDRDQRPAVHRSDHDPAGDR